jgi:hypothetical protein
VYEIQCRFDSRYAVSLCEKSSLDISNDALSGLVGERRTLVITTPTVDRLYGDDLRRYVADTGESLEGAQAVPIIREWR